MATDPAAPDSEFAQAQREGQGRGMGPRLLAVIASGICMVLCCPNYDIWVLGFMAWIPYFWAIEGRGPKAALFYGWLIGTMTVFWGFFWISDLLTRFAGFPLIGAVPITLLFAAWHGLIWGCAAAGMAWYRQRGHSFLLVAPLCWIAAEAILPNIFPIYMALGWCWQPLWIQTAEIGGVTMVSGIMVALNAAFYHLIITWRREQRLDKRAAIVAAALLVTVPAYGAIRIAQVQGWMKEQPHVKFGIVQGNMSIREMLNRRIKPRVLAAQQAKSAELQAQGAEILLWGETAYPNARAFPRGATQDLPPHDNWRVQRGFDIPIVFGAVQFDPTRENPFPFNTAIALDENGKIVDIYDKVYLLVFGEYIPLVDPKWYLKTVPSASVLSPGKGADVIRLSGYRLGPFICYEDILPRFVRDASRVGVHAFINLTNDAWFGKTDEPSQHLGLAVFRTIENRRAMVRSVNTGISTYLDPTGRAHHKTAVVDPDTEGPQPPDGFVVDVPMVDPDEHVTPYRATGELFNGLCVLALLGLWIRDRRVRPAAAASAGASGPQRNNSQDEDRGDESKGQAPPESAGGPNEDPDRR